MTAWASVSIYGRFLALATLAVSCRPADDISARISAADWTYAGCEDVVLIAVSQDRTLAVELQLKVDSSEINALQTYMFDIGKLAQATLFDGNRLDSGAFCGNAVAVDATSDPLEVTRQYGATEGHISLNVIPDSKGGRSASAAVTDLTFVVGDESVSVDLDIDPVVIGQY